MGVPTKTEYHVRIEQDYVLKTRSGAQCWFLKDGRKNKLNVPGKGQQASIHRILYAIHVGPIPPGVDLRPTECGTVRCINPWHQHQHATNFYARALDMEEVRLGQYEPRYSKARLRMLPQVLPHELTVDRVRTVKAMHQSRHSSTHDICVQVQLPITLVRKIIGGYYDEAVHNLLEEAKGGRDLKRLGHSALLDEAIRQQRERWGPRPPDGGDPQVQPLTKLVPIDGARAAQEPAAAPGAASVGVGAGGVVSVGEDGEYVVDETTDEEAWLAMNRAG